MYRALGTQSTTKRKLGTVHGPLDLSGLARDGVRSYRDGGKEAWGFLKLLTSRE